jgi:hypothetical protein
LATASIRLGLGHLLPGLGGVAVRQFSLPALFNFAAIVTAAISFTARAASVSLIPSADTMIMEVAPTNNAGGLPFFNAGGNHYAERNRGLLKFDVAGHVPTGAHITSASLTLAVVQVPGDGYAVGFFDLHRLLRNWGEGTNNPAIAPGQGTLATTNEVTWLSPLALSTNFWSAPGAAATNDYDPVISASQIVYDVIQSPYVFPDPTADPSRFVADLQFWLDHPAANFGWIFICESEDTANTVRRFASREDPNTPPLLQLSYLIPPVLTNAHRSGAQFTLSFAAHTGQTYVVQSRSAAATGSWQTVSNLGPFPTPTQAVVSDAITSAQRFYRVWTY